MRSIYTLLLIFAGILLAQCAPNRKTAYNIPEDIKGEKREELLKILEKGRQLYKQYCSGCHGIFTKGRDGIPNFTDKQLDTYTAYAIKKDPKNHAAAAHMDADQLHEVIMFLKDRKIKGAPAKAN